MNAASLIVLVASIALALGQTKYPQTRALDSNYQLSWKVLNTTHIQFKVAVQNARWFGLGISKSGLMFPADITMGFLSRDTNSITLNDFHSTAHALPTRDASQDWTMLAGSTENNNVLFEFVRALDTNDAADDMVIKPGQTHVIWSYSYNMTALPSPYHGTNRGSVDIELLSSAAVVGK